MFITLSYQHLTVCTKWDLGNADYPNFVMLVVMLTISQHFCRLTVGQEDNMYLHLKKQFYVKDDACQWFWVTLVKMYSFLSRQSWPKILLLIVLSEKTVHRCCGSCGWRSALCLSWLCLLHLHAAWWSVVESPLCMLLIHEGCEQVMLLRVKV